MRTAGISPTLRQVLVALVVGFALTYLSAVANALEVVLVQQAYASAVVRESMALTQLFLHLPTMGLSTLVLTYALGRLVFGFSPNPHPAAVLALVLPLVLQGLWFEYTTSPAPVHLLIQSILSSPMQILAWLAAGLCALLAFTQVRLSRRVLTAEST